MPEAEVRGTSPEHRDWLLHVVFGPGLRAIGDRVLQGEAFSGLRVVAEKSTPETSRETDVLIEAVKTHFVPTRRVAYPSLFFDKHPDLLPEKLRRGELPDVAAVVAGIKPAALPDEDRLFASPHGRELICRALDRGLCLARTTVANNPTLVVGDAATVAELASAFYELWQLPSSDCLSFTPEKAACHKKIGRLLGYSNDAIESFLSHDHMNDPAFTREIAKELLGLVPQLAAAPFVWISKSIYYNCMTAAGLAKPLARGDCESKAT